MTVQAANQKVPRWKSVARLWRLRLHRRRTLILGLTIIPLFLVTAVIGAFYLHYAKIADEHLSAGAFQHSLDIYGAPIILADGDGFSVAALADLLRQAAFTESTSQQPNTFTISRNSLEIFTSDGSNTTDTHVAIGASQHIERLEVNGSAVKSWSAGRPLMVSLSRGREKRQMVEFRDIPPNLVNAVVSVEDKHFFHHRGLDLPRILKAAYVDISDGHKEQGASTLTMQLVRGLWLVPEKNWKRKVAEAMMTVRLERKWSKEQIFETYANQVYLGRQSAYSIHGFAAGARMFFGKPLQDLTLPESALLAGMVQRPSFFNPYRNPDHATERRDLVLKLMRENHYIDEQQYEAAVNTPLKLAGAAEKDDSFGEPYFLDLVNDRLQELEEPEGEAKKVYTTIDLNLQRAAGEAIATGMAQVDKLLAKKYAKSGIHAEAALIALDPHTGEIKALVGGRDYATSQLNRILAKRPPGSVFKPFVYAAALNTALDGGSQVFTPSSIIDDSPTTFWSGGKTYQPANFKHESFGSMTLRQAMARSDNIAAVKLGEEVGFDSVVAMARRAGLNDDIKPTPAVALGSYAVTPLEMAAAYTPFANGGVWVKPEMVTRVSNADGEAIFDEQRESRQAIDPRLAYLMVGMLEEVMRSGTAASVRSRGFLLPAAGKTGTSHDGWFAGFTSQLLCLVWVGFDDYQELDLEGAKSALPIWTEFMKKASQVGTYRNAVEFSPPNGISVVRICTESGKLAGDLCLNTRNESFISGSEPTEMCDLHQPEVAETPVAAVAAVAADQVSPP